MPDWITAALVGAVAGLGAAAVMNGYQAATAALFGQDQSDDDPATVKAADDAARATAGEPIPKRGRAAAGSVVHYATGAVLGIVYALVVPMWPIVAIGFGVAYGLVVALVLDDVLVPAFGWGPWPIATPLKTHLYGLSAHAVFGVALEAVRRLAGAVLA